TLYRLEQNSGILHGTMMCIMNERNKNITLKTIIQLARGFNMTLLEFLDDKLFTNEDIEID
ncbi:MAG: XRE family transcriptional regulator, partial [Clostridia bacterium]|nr:XRE family transcriptional regulator [Clostridia bacterium]